jgi:predicted DNA-binding protein
MLAIRLPGEIENRLAALASRTGRTKTYYGGSKPKTSIFPK